MSVYECIWVRVCKDTRVVCVCVRVLVSSTAQRAENACVCVSRFVCARAYVCGVCVCARALMYVLV